MALASNFAPPAEIELEVVEPEVVPVPNTLALLGIGLLAGITARRYRI